ncbi:DUF5801 repeats-in-toxin domain-containing protein [Rhizobium panacihumi]|uniref:T1SS-143 repeat domain-containing protein n=1 Tax=Rhizobium panacihumi TaxID=2008450 RepID=UPI003D79DBD2
MSVEDLRVSVATEQTAADHFHSDVAEEISLSENDQRQDRDAVEMAQAAPTSGRLPTAAGAPSATVVPAVTEMTPDEANIVRLAATVSIDDIRIEGANLILVQADGTEIIIVNGATKVPTILLGDVELPQQTFIAALEDSGISVAAGPDGSYSASSGPGSSGGNFEDSIQQSQNGPLQLADLLGDTSFGDPDPAGGSETGRDEPTPLDSTFLSGIVESTSASGAFEQGTFNGRLNFDPGSEFGTVRSVALAGALTSGGVAVATTFVESGTDTNPILTLTGSASGVIVFTLVVTDVTTGAFTFTLQQPLDHTGAGSIGASDILNLAFSYTVQDKAGFPVSANFTISVGDDGPTAVAGAASTVQDEALPGGNVDGIVTASVTGVSLNIDWGADSANAGGSNDRSVVFTNANVAVAGAYGTALTSLGQAVNTVLINGTLIGYTGSTVPASVSETSVVFHASLSDAGNGSYSFTLVKPLDHAAGVNQNTAMLTFGFTAQDADGDTAANTFTVSIVDDVPVANGGTASTVEDEALTNGNDEADGLSAKSGGSLNIDWGSDNGNNGSGAAGDRSVAFTQTMTVSGAYGEALTSGGETLTLTLFGDTLVAYTGTIAPTALTGEGAGNIVFTVTLSDLGRGSYEFTLLKTLDHAPGAGGNGENTLVLTFGYTATDSDGDTASSTFAVNVVDDTLTFAGGEASDIYEDKLFGGNPARASEEPGSQEPGQPATPVLLRVISADNLTVGGSLRINWGADNGNAVENGGITNTVNDRGVGFTAPNIDALSAQNLTSDGIALKYELSDNGTILTAYKEVPAIEGEGTVRQTVFTVTLSDTDKGSYEFKLEGNLDHPKGSGENSLAINFAFTAQDADGDTGTSAFTVTVKDDVPTVGKPVTLASVDEDDLRGGNDVRPRESLSSSADLGVVWGSDNAKVGDIDATVHRTLAFSKLTEALVGLTSDGYALEAGDITDLANGGQMVKIFNTHGDAIFRLTLDPTTDGGNAKFELLGNLDHLGEGSEDTLKLNFEFTATDADGDAIGGSFSIDVIDDAPVWLGATNSTVEEEDLPGGNEDTSGAGDLDFTLPFIGHVNLTQKSSFGTLGIAWGSDNNNPTSGAGLHDRSVVFDSVSEGTSVTYGDGTVLKSNGLEVKYHIADDGRTLIGYTGASAETGTVVFQVTVSDDGILGAGRYDFLLKATLDHPTGGGENRIDLAFDFLATDSDGDDVGGSFTVTVLDDKPVQGRVQGNSGLNEDDVSNYTATDATPNSDPLKIENRSLGISWGADNDTRGEGDNYGRSVHFATTASAHVAASANVYSSASAVGLSISGGTLSSGGVALVYVVTDTVDGGQILTAYKGSVSGDVVFIAKVDALATNGAYSFELKGELDHASGSNSIDLTFGFVGTDADGDDAGRSTFRIAIADDQPVQGTAENVSLTEDDISTYPATDATQTDVTKTAAASLGISWGADDDIRSGANDTFGRTVQFGTSAAKAGTTAVLTSIPGLTADGGALSSGGVALVYRVVNDTNGGQTLTAYKGINGPVVFQVVLDPTSTNGSYTFEMKAELDHTSGSDAVTLKFTFVGTDADGDAASAGNFEVTIADDKPVQGVAGNVSLTEDDISTYPLTDETLRDITRVGASLGISWGADDDKRGTTNGDTFGRSVQFGTDATKVTTGSYLTAVPGLSAEGGSLSSGGVALVYRVVNDTNGGQTLTAYKGANGPVVFQVVLDPTSTNGSYTFEMKGELDHAIGSDSVKLTFTFVGTDADGDAALAGSFNVAIADDKPVVLGPFFDGAVDEDGGPLASGNGNPGPLFGAGDMTLVDTVTTRSLNISWGADDANIHVNGGIVGQPQAGDRSVTFGDMAAPTGLTSNGVQLVYTVSANGTLLTATAGENGPAVFTVELSDQSSGSYTFSLLRNLDHVRGGEENDLKIDFKFVATDADGDQVGNSFSVIVDDDTPVIGNPKDSRVAEVAIGSSDGSKNGSLDISWGADQGNSTVNGGNLSANGNRSVVLVSNSAPSGLTSNGIPVVYKTSADGLVLTAYRIAANGHYIGAEGQDLGTAAVDAARVFTVSVSDVDRGSYTFTLLDNLDHFSSRQSFNPGSGVGSAIDLDFNFKATDSDGDSVTSSFEVTVLDTTPSLASLTAASSVVDEDGLTPNGIAGAPAPYASSDAAGEATTTNKVSLGVNWGQDADLKNGTGDQIGRTVSFVGSGNNDLGTGSVSAANLGLPALTSGGVALTYSISYLNGANNWNGGYVLTAKAGNAEIFKVTIDPTDANGSYKFDLLGKLDHPVANSEDNIDLTFKFRAADSDGDKTAIGSFSVSIDDDAPVAAVAVNSEALVLDETAAVQTGTDDKSAAAPIAFTAHGTVLNWAQNAVAMVTTAGTAYGADGAGNTVLSLTTKTGAAFNGEDSGLKTLDGSAIKLYSVGDIVVGKTSANGPAVIALSIDNNGIVSMAQYVPIKHGNMYNPDDSSSLTGVHVSVVATDYDGDAAKSTSSSALTITVRDDGPTVSSTQVTLTVDEDGLASGNGGKPAYAGDAAATSNTASGNLSYSFGTDGKSASTANDFKIQVENTGLKSFGTSLTYSFDTATHTLTAKAGNVAVFTFELTNIANGAYTFTLLRPLDHSVANTEDDIAINFKFTITDGDGDTATGNVQVVVNDDAPYIGTPAAGLVSESGLGFIGGNSTTVHTGDLNISWGADNRDASNNPHIAVAFANNLTAPAGLTSDGDAIKYAFNSDRTVLTGYTGGGLLTKVVFTVSLSEDGSGKYTFRLYDNIDHASNSDSLPLSFAFTAKDSDGDTAASSFTVTVADDKPVFGAIENETVNEDSLPATLWDVIIADSPESAIQIGRLGIDWGADNNNQGSANRSLTFDAALNNATSAFTHDGIAIKYFLSADRTELTAKAGTTEIFRVSLSDSLDGSYTFTLLDSIDHKGTGNDVNAKLSFSVIAKDSDGDTDTGSFSVTVVDTIPTVGSIGIRSIDEATTNNAGGNTFLPQTISNVDLNIDWKADDANTALANRSVVFDADRMPSGLTSNGFQLQYVLSADGTTVTAYRVYNGMSYTSPETPAVHYASAGGGDLGVAPTDAARVFSATLSDLNSGRYSFTLYGNLDHAVGSNLQNVTLGFTVTDSDGDAVDAAFTVKVNDSVPQETGAPVNGSVSEADMGPVVLTKSFGLNIDWNADAFAKSGNAGSAFVGRHLEFKAGTAGTLDALGLKSGGETLAYDIRTAANGVDQELVAYKSGDASHAPVFIVSLNSQGTNSAYVVALFQPLDHVGSGGANLADITLNLTAVAVDGDGDTLDRAFKLTFGDYLPTAPSGAAAGVTIEEAAGSPSNDHALSADFGSDGKGAVPFIFSGDAAPAVSGSSAMTGLRSNGVTLNYIQIGATTILAYLSTAATVPASATDASVVFAVTLGASGYNFVLNQPLDHPAPNADNQHFIDLAFDFKAVDFDGDVSATAGTFTVRIDAAGTIGSINYSALETGVLVNLSDLSTADMPAEIRNLLGGESVAAHTATDRASVTDDVVGIDQLGAITEAYGSKAADILIGGAGDNILHGGAGADYLFGGDGNDTLYGDDDNDVIFGNVGNDTLYGGDGADTLIGGTGNDTFWGGKASDNIFGNGTTNTGSDLYATAGESDTAAYLSGAANYTVVWNQTRQIWEVTATATADEYTGMSGPGTNIDSLFGIEIIKFPDITLDLLDPVRLFNGNNLVGTFDTIQDANDAASAGYRIELVGSLTTKTATITRENLTVFGASDQTGITLTLNGVQKLTLTGTAPINVVGDDGNNTIIGNDGANIITSGKGADTLYGGNGNDTFIITADIDDASGEGSRNFTIGDGTTKPVVLGNRSGESDSIHGGDGIDTIQLVAANGFVFDRANYPGSLSGVERFIGTAFSDVIMLPTGYTSGTDPIYIDGGAGADFLQGSNAQADHIVGGDGDDWISGLGGDDRLEGGNGADTIWGGDGNDRINGGSGDDILYGDAGEDRIYGSDGNDEIHGGADDDELHGEGGSDTIYGDAGNDTVYGGDGNDKIDGGEGNDALYGQNGDDTIRGGAGNDRIGGGSGYDTAVYDDARGNYTIGVVSDASGFVTAFTTVTETVVTGTDEGKDTLTDVEALKFGNLTLDLTDKVQLFNSSNTLIGTFDKIQDAITASASVAGAVKIVVAAGTYDENLVIDRDNLTLISRDGADTTIINGVQSGTEQGAIEIKTGADAITIGSIGHGFTVFGLNGNGASEKAAIYIQGDHNSITIQGNTVTAQGDEALLTEYGRTIVGLKIDSNLFNGKTFVGDTVQVPGPTPPNGVPDQFKLDNNVPRGLVVINAGLPVKWVDFTNNVVDGVAGGSDATGAKYGNTLVTIDATNSNIHHNLITGYTTGGAAGLRVRGGDTNITENVVDNSAHNSQSIGFIVDNKGTTPNYNANKVIGSGAGEILQGTPGGDTIIGNDGDDVILYTLGQGADTVNGGAGSDTLKVTTPTGTPYLREDIFAVNGELRISVNDGTAADLPFEKTLTARNIETLDIDVKGYNWLVFGQNNGSNLASAGIETVKVTGDDNGNTVYFSNVSSATKLEANLHGGNDTFVAGGQAISQQVDGGDGIDHFDFSQVSQQLTIDLQAGTAIRSTLGGTLVAIDAITHFEDVTGSIGNDVIRGTSAANVLKGGDGNDIIEGRGGNDTIDGGNGIDTAVYSGARSGYTIDVLADASGFVTSFSKVTDGNSSATGEGSDTLTSIEVLKFGNVTLDLTDKVQLFDNTNRLIGTFDHIQDAINASLPVAGAVKIVVAAGTYEENLVIGRGNLTLVSQDGAGSTIIDGVQESTANGTIDLKDNANNVTIGSVGHGFTIIGLNGTGAGEKAAIYIDGRHNNVLIQGNTVTAEGDAALLAKGTGPISGLKIENNTFNGQTFVDTAPATAENAPRGLVVIGNGDGAAYAVTGVNFYKNTIEGISGIIAPGGVKYGNALVIIDATDSNIDKNTFAGFTTADSGALVARGPRINITENVVNNSISNSESTGFIIDNKNSVPYPNYNANKVIGGLSGETLYGSPSGDTITGNDGNDVIIGGKGNDTIDGGAGDDRFIWNSGDGRDKVEGGIGTDVQVMNGSSEDETFNINRITLGGVSHVGINVETTSGAVAATSSNYEVATHGVEDIVINTGAGNDTVIVSGSLDDTGLAYSTITVDGGAGNDTIDLTGLTSNHRVVVEGGEGQDVIKLAGKWSDYSYVQTGDVYTVSKNGLVLATTHNVEQLAFTGNDGIVDYAIEIGKVVNVAPEATDDSNFVIEAGGIANGLAGSPIATGNVLANDTDGNIGVGGNAIDAMKVTAANGSAMTTGGLVINGMYGTLTIKADGSYSYALDNSRTVTQALKVGQTGHESFSYEVSDLAGAKDTAHLNIDVRGADDAGAITTLGFEDVAPYSDAVQIETYGGFAWTIPGAPGNAHALYAMDYAYAVYIGNTQTTGYDNFGSDVAYTPYGNEPVVITRPDHADFYFAGVKLSAAWIEGLSVTITGYNDNAVIGTATSAISVSSIASIAANWGLIDKLVIDVAGAEGSGSRHIVVDDFQYALSSVSDPIVLDLDHNGFAFSSIDNGVSFDINADGHQDKVAWTSTDGILAYDLDGNGKIDNGSELFTPSFNGGHYASGLAALATLDSNGDGKIDAHDEAFSKLSIWIDANNDGVSDAGELSSLFDHAVSSISLEATVTNGLFEDGQAVLSQGHFTLTDGSTGDFLEVGLDTAFGGQPDHVVIGGAGDDILVGGAGFTQFTGGAGADTFVLDPSALQSLDMADVVTDYKAGEGDVLDVSKLLDSMLGHKANGDEAAANVRTTITGADTTVSVQVATDSWKDVAVLQNHTEAVKILFDDKHTVDVSHH